MMMTTKSDQQNESKGRSVDNSETNAVTAPSIQLPKGGGALKGIDEKFSVNAVNGTGTFSIPLPASAARGVSPSLSLTYNSGSGNGIFGLGWELGLASIRRKTDKGLPQYFDATDSDVFLFSDAEDLVPEFKKEPDGSFSHDMNGDYIVNEKESPDHLYTIRFYRPRIEGLFSRIERWTEKATGVMKWRVITKSNVTTLFGWSSGSVIADLKDGKKIYEWLPEFVFDDKGNCCRYVYKKEDDKGLDHSLVHMKNRVAAGAITYTNLYPEKVLYGNKTPYKKFGDAFPPEADFLFRTVFDYGEYDAHAAFLKIKDWDYREDAFSNYKPGFEIRTTRLCKRVMHFHFFSELPGGSALVKSLDFEYDTGTLQDFTFLRSITSWGYIKKDDGTYTCKKFPPVEFGYQEHQWNKEVKNISAENLVHAPAALDEPEFQFTDLYNEGLAGILSEQADGWYYKHNLGNGKFERAKLVTPKPSFTGVGRTMQLADLDADGGKQLVNMHAEPKGYFELDDDNEWQLFRTFRHFPNINFSDSNARMLDLNGDGKADVLITEENVFTWYSCEGRNGFSEARKTAKSVDEETGPHVVFADPQQTIFLADMSGDGMTDIVRIRNGEVCYWPNLGYGKFGAKVAMDHSPVFDHPDSFNPAFLKLADIDGSGTTDIIYTGKNKFSCWMNLCGNSFSTVPFEIENFPPVNDQVKITVSDLLGNGVACIVWSSSLPANAAAPLQYVDLMNGVKPHLLVSFKNNQGKEVSLEYTPSTKFYIDDKLAGKPWITRLHFPVHCISKTETRDKISGYRFVTSYRYHHGYYDHPEREFRGFGMVEQSDTEYFDHWKKGDATHVVEDELHQEPVITKSWFHTGAYTERGKILGQFASEYWYEEMERQGFAVAHPETPLPDARLVAAPGIPAAVIDNLGAEEWWEALRSCKSMALRSEVFAHDAPAVGATAGEIKTQLTPFMVATHNCVIELLQPKGKNKHAVFVVKESEGITYNYERNTTDPRISHCLNIKIDEYGNVLESATVVYARMHADLSLPDETRAAQNKITISYAQTRFTNDHTGNDFYRLRLVSEEKTFELKGVAKTGAFYVLNDFKDILSDLESSTAEYHELDKPLVPGKAQKRLIENKRHTYYSNTLAAGLPLHHLEFLAVPFETFRLAYTPLLLNDIFGGKATDLLMAEGKFTHSEMDGNWWIPSGTIQFIEGAETAADAQNRFYVPVSYTDPYNTKTKVKYYGSYFLFVEETEDMLGNKSRVDLFNFRTLSPQRMRDVNNNLSEAISDELGLVKATAVFGKGSEADDLTGLSADTSLAEQNEIDAFFAATLSTDLVAKGKSLLKHATARFVYDLDVYKNSGKPVVAAAIVREEHYQKNNNSPIQLSFEYSNGLGKTVMKKVQAAPGLAKKVTVNPDNTYSVNDEDTTSVMPVQLRWIGNGRTVLNNKGNAVKQYEPYFSVTHRYEDLKELVESGVTPVIFYDAMNRVVKTKMPDGTFSRTEFDSWKQVVYDANDTALESGWYHDRENHLIDAELTAEGKDPGREKIAAEKAAKHAHTPVGIHFDTLGRKILLIEHNKNMLTDADEFTRTKMNLDIEGNQRSIFDARELPENGGKGNTVTEDKFDMLGNKVYEKSMDKGQRWLLTDVLGKPLRTWDERMHEFQYFYDTLHRATQAKVIGGDGDAPLDHIFDRIIYGESLLLPGRTNEAALQSINILGKPVRHFDTAGAQLTPEYDFKGQPKFTTRKLFGDYKSIANWTDVNLVAALESDEFTFTTETDALGRITKQIAPDESVITPSYNETGLLNAETVAHKNPALTATYIENIEYNEKGRRNKIIYGNDVSTRFYYDKKTFRLIRLESKRLNGDPLQDWNYTYDAIGNLTHIEDKNIPLEFFNNQKTTGLSEYTYDALYRLREAKGRENDAALTFDDKDNWNDFPFMNQLNPGNPMTVRNYTQRYGYDEAGNITQMQHTAAGNNWTRDYTYEKLNNRLKNSQVGLETYNYAHHLQHGFITAMPHLAEMDYNFKEELVKTAKQKVLPASGTAETTYYQYDSEGQRVRKITENAAAFGVTPTKKNERIYFSGYETFRTYQSGAVNFERESLSLIDEGNRFVMIETVKQNTDPAPDPSDGVGARLMRYQLHNHVGSAALELDGTPDSKVIFYEEYHPFGTTAYQAKNATIKAAAKRYRFTGMERDDETGLEYHGARYYVPWLGRWISGDPVGIKDNLNVYAYVSNSPVMLHDKTGTQGRPADYDCVRHRDNPPVAGNSGAPPPPQPQPQADTGNPEDPAEDPDTGLSYSFVPALPAPGGVHAPDFSLRITRPIIHYPPLVTTLPQYTIVTPVLPPPPPPDTGYDLSSDLANTTAAAGGNRARLLVLEHRFDLSTTRSSTTIMGRYGVTDNISASVAGAYVSPYTIDSTTRPGFSVTPQLRVWGTPYSSSTFRFDLGAIFTGQYDSSSPGDPGSVNGLLALSFKWPETDSTIDINGGIQGTFGSPASGGTAATPPSTGGIFNIALTQRWLSMEFNVSYLSNPTGSTARFGTGLAFRVYNAEATTENRVRNAASIYLSPYGAASSTSGGPISYSAGLGVTTVLGVPFF